MIGAGKEAGVLAQPVTCEGLWLATQAGDLSSRRGSRRRRWRSILFLLVRPHPIPQSSPRLYRKPSGLSQRIAQPDKLKRNPTKYSGAPEEVRRLAFCIEIPPNLGYEPASRQS